MPKLQTVAPHGDCSLKVTWCDGGSRSGLTEIVDLRPVIGTYKFYRPLRNDAGLFATARVNDLGTAVLWGSGDELDMASTTVERLAEESMTSADFQKFLDDHNLTHNAAALVLGYKRRQIENFLSGEQPVPRVVALACFGYEARQYETRFARFGAALAYKDSLLVTTDRDGDAVDVTSTTVEGVA
jgi:hypothetical protein